MELDFSTLGSCLFITVISLFVGFAFKRWDRVDNKWIPVIVGLTGWIVGILAFVLHVDWFAATDPISATAIGIVSGMSSTGFHQLVKQMTENK